MRHKDKLHRTNTHIKHLHYRLLTDRGCCFHRCLISAFCYSASRFPPRREIQTSSSASSSGSSATLPESSSRHTAGKQRVRAHATLLQNSCGNTDSATAEGDRVSELNFNKSVLMLLIVYVFSFLKTAFESNRTEII